MIKDNKTFDILRTVCEVLLPAISAAYFSLAEIWGLPLADKICGTISILIVFIGSLINVERSRYNKQNGGEK